jgi:uncharacterized ion transporter superfamily protein YfcC
VTHTLLDFFVPAGSGQAALMMWVMTPLSDLVHQQWKDHRAPHQRSTTTTSR